MIRSLMIVAGFIAMISSTRAADLAELFSGAAPINLTADSVGPYFKPSLVIANFSRDRCIPVLKAAPGSTLPVVASFIGTTLHQPCAEPQKVIIMKFQFRSDSSAEDAAALGNELRGLEGAPCFEGLVDRRQSILWSNKDRVIGVFDGIDQGSGYTVSFFSRAAVTPAKSEADEQAYKVWDSSVPTPCQMPRTRP